MTSLVQSKTTSFTGTSLQTASFASAPTQGNLLVAVITGNASVAFSTTPFGATTDRERVITSQCAVRIYSKVAGASESSDVTAQWSSASSYDLTLYEFAPTAGKVWDSTRIDQANDNADPGSGVTSLSTGTTSATTVADDAVVGAVGHNGLSGAANTATNSFTPMATPSAPLRGRVAHLIASATGTQETTFGWTTARRAVSAIVAYKQTATSTQHPVSATTTATTTATGTVVLRAAVAARYTLAATTAATSGTAADIGTVAGSQQHPVTATTTSTSGSSTTIGARVGVSSSAAATTTTTATLGARLSVAAVTGAVSATSSAIDVTTPTPTVARDVTLVRTLPPALTATPLPPTITATVLPPAITVRSSNVDLPERLYANDTPGPYRTFTVKAPDAATFEFTPTVVTSSGVALGPVSWVAAAYQVGSEWHRAVKVALRKSDGTDLAKTNHYLRLVIPGGNDVNLGSVTLN